MAKQSKKLSMDIGISESDRKKIADGLSALLADSYTLYLMTHNFHWNVTGPQFNTLHTMFMTQYTEQWTALDLIAERIRALGFPAPGTYKEFVKLASIKEVDGVPKATDMIRHLVADIAGNIWEWTETCFQNGTLTPDGTGFATRSDYCGVRAVQGKHRAFVIDFIRDARSGGCAAGVPPDYLGFRLVRD